MRAVVLIVGFAILALQARGNLSANTDTVANLHGRHLVTDFDGFANNLMSDTEGQWCFAPATRDAVDVRTTDPAGVDLDVDISVTEWLRFELREEYVSFVSEQGGICPYALLAS